MHLLKLKCITKNILCNSNLTCLCKSVWKGIMGPIVTSYAYILPTERTVSQNVCAMKRTAIISLDVNKNVMFYLFRNAFALKSSRNVYELKNIAIILRYVNYYIFSYPRILFFKINFYY